MIRARKIVENIEFKNEQNKAHIIKEFDQEVKYQPDTKKPILVNIENLTKYYRVKFKKARKFALNGVNLQIREGERIGIYGDIGSGKSTLIEIICGAQEKSCGEINYGYEYKKSPYENIAVQFQGGKYPYGLSVKDVIDLMQKIKQNIKVDKNELDQLIKTLGLSDLMKKEVNSLSGGQKQRLSILLALMTKPKILLADNLVASLDIDSKEMIVDFLKKYLNENDVTFVCITSDMGVMQQLCNNVILMKNGQIKLNADIKKVISKYKSLGSFLIKNLQE